MGDFVYMVDILYIYVYMMYLDYYKELLVEQLSLKFDMTSIIRSIVRVVGIVRVLIIN